MQYFFLVLGLIIFSMIGTAFAITPVYYSKEKCNIDNDLQNYHKSLQNNTIVNTFMQKYPNAISIPATGWDDSSPQQTSVHYRYEDNSTTVNLTLSIFGHDPLDTNDCFTPFSYTLNYQNSTKTLQITNHENDTKELHDFLSGLVATIPITQNDILTNYENSDIILEGKVISSNSINKQTSYDIQVEHYYKGKLPSKMMTVFESTQKPSFEKDDRVVLYIQQKDRYLVLEPSFRVDYECNSGSWGSFLAPKYEDILIRGSPATGNFPEFSEPDNTSGLYKAGNEMKITYNVENYGPMIKHATVNISVFSNQETVFSDQRSVTVPACSGRVPLSWNFVPESGDYSVQITISGTYEVDGKSFQFQEPKVASDFKARSNGSGGSLDRTVYPIYFSDSDYSIYSLKHKQYEYFIPYTISDAKIDKITIDCGSASLIVYLSDSVAQGQITLNIPRKLVDTKIQGQDNDFIILIDGKEADFEETDSNLDSRTLQIHLAKSTTMIEILASSVGQFPEPAICGVADTDDSPYYRLLSTLQQFKTGILINQIQCKDNLVLLLHPITETPACVKPQTEQKLVSRGWYYLVPFGNNLTEPNTIIIYDVDEDHGTRLSIAPYEIVMNLTDGNTVTFVNDGSTIVNIFDNSKGIWHFDNVEPSSQRTLIINGTGFYEFLVQNSRFGESGEIVALSEHTNSLPVETKAKMAQTIVTNKHLRMGVEIMGVGSDGAEPGITITIDEKFKDKYDDSEKYYYEKYKEIIPFDVPITIKFGTPIMLQ